MGEGALNKTPNRAVRGSWKKGEPRAVREIKTDPKGREWNKHERRYPMQEKIPEGKEQNQRRRQKNVTG